MNDGYLHNGIMAVLKYYSDPDVLFNEYIRQQEKIEEQENPY
jgi:hypothetical protein